ncbi:MAG: hypothetical protein ACRERD_05040 [Candidatus Binatia bacterium]
MNDAQPPQQQRRDSDLVNALVALRRAAKRARERAARVGSVVVIYRDGKIIEESPQEKDKDR